MSFVVVCLLIMPILPFMDGWTISLCSIFRFFDHCNQQVNSLVSMIKSRVRENQVVPDLLINGTRGVITTGKSTFYVKMLQKLLESLNKLMCCYDGKLL